MQRRPAVNRSQMSRPWPYSRPQQQAVEMARQTDLASTPEQRVATLEASGTRMIVSGAAAGAPTGTMLLVTGTHSGTPTFTLTNNAGDRFAIDGNSLVAGTIATDHGTATSHDITVAVDGVLPQPPPRTLTINVQPAP